MRPRQSLVARVIFISLPIAILPMSPGIATPLFPNLVYLVSPYASTILVADFNNDGIQDFAVAGSRPYSPPIPTPIGSLDVFLGKSDGSFAVTWGVSVLRSPAALAAGDFNGDGILDIVCADSDTNQLYVLLGNGDGSFVFWSRLDVHRDPYSVAVADFDHDGNLDLAVSDFGSGDIAVFLGLGNGMFRPLVSYAVDPFPNSIASGDFNSDGIVDLATANQGSNDVSILLGKGDGTFAPQIRFPAGSDPTSLKVGDFNGDSIQDLVTVEFSLGEVDVLLGHGDGTFDHAIVSSAGGVGASSVALGDFNQDGKEDLVVGNSYFESTSILLGDGHGEFVATSPVNTVVATGLAVGDFNRDGSQDLIIVTDDRVIVLQGSGDGTFGPHIPFTPGNAFSDMVTQDFNGDGNADLAGIRLGDPVGSASAGSLQILLGVGDGTFNVQPPIPLGVWPVSIRAGDFNSDGVPDLVVVSRGLASVGIAGDIRVFLGDGNGGFPNQQRLNAGNVPSSVVVGDFNGDGIQDLVVANAGGEPSVDVRGGLSLFPGNGDGAFARAVNLNIILHPRLLVVGDFNADGKLDLAVAGTDPTVPGTLFILLGKGDGTFQLMAHLSPADGEAAGMVLGDFNGDGREDIAFTVGAFSCGGTSVYPTVTLILGQGDGTFVGSPVIYVGACPYRLAVGDFNADRVDDLAIVNSTSRDLSVLLGSKDEGLLPEARFQVGDAPGAFAVNDFDGDTRPDIAASHFGGVSVLLNQGPFPDADADGIPSLTDPCTDTDGDGFGNPGFRANTCPADNCPNVFNPSQADADGDRRGDACDPCTDTDHDGFGDPGFPVNLCRIDNCLAVSNPDQADSNHDGSGDACQPSLTLYGLQHTGEKLEVVLSATDPQNDPLSGAVEISVLAPSITLPDSYASRDCSQGYLPGRVIGEGIGFTNGAAGAPYLFDLNSILYCNGDIPDYIIARGTCDHPQTPFNAILPLTDVVLPAPLCLRGSEASEGGADLTILSFDDSTLALSTSPAVVVLHAPFEHRLPAQLDLPGLVSGETCRLRVTVTDGTTVPVTVEEFFAYQGESKMTFVGPNSPPHAVVSSVATVECSGLAGGAVTLDASGSTDTDSTLGTNDDIVAFEWFEGFGAPSQTFLGSGPRLSVQLTLGHHVLTLQVTDSRGATGTAQAAVTVVDATPPVVVCPSVGPVECSALGGSTISLVATATDACSQTVTVTNSRTAGGNDASTFYPLGTTSVTFAATDASGNLATCTSSVQVRDTTPPSLALTLSPTILWPPNHRMVLVQAASQVSDSCDPTAGAILVSATSSEADDATGSGDGNTTGDIQDASIGTPDTAVLLRAERLGEGPGRVYTLTYAARDASGNTASALGIVTVPHDEGTGPEPVMMSVEEDSTPGMAHLYWNAVPGAEMYDVIQGDLSEVSVSNGEISLGPVHVLGSGQPGASYREGPSGAIPVVGSAFFYLVQYREGQSASGWGTESSPWPAEPSFCDIGCSGEPVASSVASMTVHRK